MADEDLTAKVDQFLRGGLELEGRILAEGQQLRDRAKAAYGSDLLDARLSLMATFWLLLSARDGVPGKSDDSRSHRLVLLSTFVQGVPATETLISEGQYSKAAAVLKQDYELLARLREVREGTAKPGKTPQAKAAPEGSQRIYGDLNKVAHPSNEGMLKELLGRLEQGEVRGVSPIPAFNRDVARQLYEVHVFTMIHAVREAIMLFMEMYEDGEDVAREATQRFLVAVGFAERAGFIVPDSA